MVNTKLGVVLSGGGAKGAYEAGFLKALSELNIQPDAIAGTSIGALNGAIVASNKDIHKTARIVEDLWQELAQDNVLEVDSEQAVKNIVEIFTYFAPLPITKLTKIALLAFKKSSAETGLLTQSPIVNRLDKYAKEENLHKGLPFYVAMTPTKGDLKDVANFVGFGKENVVFKKIQDLPKGDVHKAIMASAALPILFESIEIDGKHYRDGCLGSTDNEWGNTPALPLVKNEKCTHLIVCHLNEGSFFNRHDPIFKNIPIIEIRPTSGTFSNALDPLKFSVDKIDKWIQQGYEDTKRILQESFEVLHAIRERKQSESLSDESVNRLLTRNFKLD